MISYASGDLLSLTREDVEAVVLPISSTAAMDEGCSLHHLYNIPHRWSSSDGKERVARRYGALVSDLKRTVKKAPLTPGQLYPASILDDGVPDVILAVVREDGPSATEWIDKCLESIKAFCKGHGISRLAIPLIGTGSGGLGAKEVGRMITAAFKEDQAFSVTIFVPLSMLTRSK